MGVGLLMTRDQFSVGSMQLRLTRHSNETFQSTSRYELNPNTQKSYKISQNLSPKHTARGIAQSPYHIYKHRKACLSKQPPWRAAGDPRLAHGRSRVQAPAPAGALHVLFSTLPSFLLQEIVFFAPFPPNPQKVLGLLYTTGWVYYKIPNTIKSYKISKTRSTWCCAIALPYKACLSKQHPWRAAGHGDPLLACGRSRAWAPAPGGTLRTLFFSTLSSFLPFLHLPPQTHESVRVIVVMWGGKFVSKRWLYTSFILLHDVWTGVLLLRVLL